mgnify:CR=1 FL=1
MYKLYKLISWIVRFKKEKRDFELASEFYKAYMPDGEEKDKNIGASLMSAEQSQGKYEATVKLLKEMF